METLLIVVALTLGVSAFCSLLEATLYSTRVATLEAAKAGGGRKRASASRFLELKRDIASPTSAILILNTIANTAGATLAGWLAARALGPDFVPVFSVCFTLGILFLSEILPKTYGATMWQVLWPWLSLPLSLLVRFLKPAVWLTRKFSALFMSESAASAVTEDEIRATIRLSARAGELTANELQMLDAVFHFDDTTVQQIMVPRDEVVFCDLDAEPAAIAETLKKFPFTRYPACRGNLDHVIGMLHARDLMDVPIGPQTDLSTFVREVLQVPETLPISELLRQMQDRRRHMALVIDEHGTVAGMVTITEVLEQIVGSLRDELEQPTRARAIAREPGGTFLLRGNVALAQVNRELGLDLYDPSIVTLSGLLVSRLGRLPAKGDVVELEGGLAEVLDVLQNRATRIRLKLDRPPSSQRGGPESGGDRGPQDPPARPGPGS